MFSPRARGVRPTGRTLLDGGQWSVKKGSGTYSALVRKVVQYSKGLISMSVQDVGAMKRVLLLFVGSESVGYKGVGTHMLLYLPTRGRRSRPLGRQIGLGRDLVRSWYHVECKLSQTRAALRGITQERV